MSDKRQQMQGFLNTAKAVMNRVEQISPKIASKGQPTLSESLRLEGLGGGGDYNEYPSTYNPQYEPQYEPQEYIQQPNGFSPAAKNLPSGILESITQNPIQNQMGGLSVLDSLIPQQPRQPQQQPRQPQQPRQQINENYGEKQIPTTEEVFRSRNRQNYQQPEYPTYQPSPVGGIDYSVISSLIKTAISEEMTKLRKTIINENKQGNVAGDVIIKMGNGIQFITKDGNIYEGKLVKAGNINDFV